MSHQIIDRIEVEVAPPFGLVIIISLRFRGELLDGDFAPTLGFSFFSLEIGLTAELVPEGALVGEDAPNSILFLG